jgi:hypothetical protein
MKPFRIKKSELIERVTKNRDEHRSIYEKAIEGYKTAAAVHFAEQLDKAKAGQPFITFFNEPVPQDHTDDYEAVLDAWEMTQDDEIELSVQEFRQYVRDEWGWKQEFTATSANYIAPDSMPQLRNL